MKKIFTLIAAAVMAVSANAEVIYSWSSTGPEGVVEIGGKATAVVDEARVNYVNTCNDVTYYTICLCGKKTDIDGTAHVDIVFDKALAAGDQIAVTAYRNKNATGKAANIHFKYENGDPVNDTNTWPNLHLEGEADPAPATFNFTVEEGNAGSTKLTLTRNSSGTNLFITKFEITRGGETGGIEDVTVAEDENAPMYNLQGVQVDENYKGIVIKNGKKYLNK